MERLALGTKHGIDREILKQDRWNVPKAFVLLVDLAGGPPGSRSRHLGIKRNFPMVVLCRSRCVCPLFSRNRVVSSRSRLVVLQKYEA